MTNGNGRIEEETAEWLLDEMARSPVLHPGAVLLLLHHLSSSLVAAVCDGRMVPSTHRALIAIAQAALEAAERVERHLGGSREFNWHRHREVQDQHWEHLYRRLDRAEARAERAEERLNAYRAGLDRNATRTEAPCEFP